MTKHPNDAGLLRDQLQAVRARHDSGAVSPAMYATIKQLEQDIAWAEHNVKEKPNDKR
jgi:hypothetical protein